jgi:hypothetical protein
MKLYLGRFLRGLAIIYLNLPVGTLLSRVPFEGRSRLWPDWPDDWLHQSIRLRWPPPIKDKKENNVIAAHADNFWNGSLKFSASYTPASYSC